jgi:hypothetical protein
MNADQILGFFGGAPVWALLTLAFLVVRHQAGDHRRPLRLRRRTAPTTAPARPGTVYATAPPPPPTPAPFQQIPVPQPPRLTEAFYANLPKPIPQDGRHINPTIAGAIDDRVAWTAALTEPIRRVPADDSTAVLYRVDGVPA